MHGHPSDRAVRHYTVARLTRALLMRHFGTCLLIDQDTLDESWEAGHFLLELPGKWRASFVAMDDEQNPVGFAIASNTGTSVHLHRLAVRAFSADVLVERNIQFYQHFVDEYRRAQA